MTDDKLPKYKLDLAGIGILFMGGLVPNIGLALLFFVPGGKDFLTSPIGMVVSNLIMWLTIILAFDFLICKNQTGRRLKFDFSSVSLKSYLIIFPMMFGMMLIGDVIAGLIPTEGEILGALYKSFDEMMCRMQSSFSAMFIAAVIMAPLFEEGVFRGIIQKGLINGKKNPQAAIWISALLFGIVHANPWQFVGGVLLGYVLGVVYHRTGSLLLPILLHAFNNLSSILLVKLTDEESFSKILGVSPLVLFAAGVSIFGIFYYLFKKLSFKNGAFSSHT